MKERYIKKNITYYTHVNIKYILLALWDGPVKEWEALVHSTPHAVSPVVLRPEEAALMLTHYSGHTF